jgi:hypothetical protein
MGVTTETQRAQTTHLKNNKPAVQKGFKSGTPGLLGPSAV